MRYLHYIIETEKEFWQKIYNSEEDHWVNKEVSRLTKKAVKVFGPFKSVLEIGCAAGIDTFYLARYSKSIIGIDIIQDVIDIANNNLKKQSKSIKSKIIFEIGDAEKLKYNDKQFDFVYSLSVLHSTDIKKSLKEIRRVLIDTGKSVIYVYIKSNTKDKVVNKEEFLSLCYDYFNILSQSEVETKKDDGGNNHVALIVFLEAKK
jgi:ubiquinone/menaquinone biosynthesis C-methylase UbiE